METKTLTNLIILRTAALLAVLLTLTQLSTAGGQGIVFTYQGHLVSGTNPANGLYEMQFSLYNSVTNGALIGVPVSVAPVAVSNGLFTVLLDFGAAPFMGANRWLEITVNLFGSDMVPTILRD